MEANLICNALPEQERETFASHDQKLAKLYKGGGLDAWLDLRDACTRVRQIAMDAARVNSVKSGFYIQKLPHILRRTLPHMLEGDRVREEFSCLLYLAEPENSMRLDAYREQLTAAQLAALATPKAARNAVRRIIKAEELEAEAKRMRAHEATAPAPVEPEPPTITDEQFLAAFKRRKLSQLSAMLVSYDFDRSNDLWKLLQSEIKARRADAKADAAKAAADADPVT